MKRFFTILLLIFTVSVFSQGYIKSFLQNEMNQANGDLIPVIIKLNSQVNLVSLKQDLLKKDLSLEERRVELIKALYNSNKRESDFDLLINNLQRENPSDLLSIKNFWSVNALACKTTPEIIIQLVNHPEVEYIQFDYPVSGEKVTETLGPVNKSINAEGQAELGLIAINARPMWALGYTGRNRIAMNIDTGVSVEHPTLKDRFLGHYLPLSQTWFGYENPSPYDVDQSYFHGTHTMGTMIGLDTANADTIGLAMNAFWIASDPVVSNIEDVRPLSDYFMAFEWALNPDGDLNTSNDIPDVINNSWGVTYSYWANTWSADCNPIEYNFIESLEAADCSVIFSNGNEGPNPTTTGMPAGIIIDTLNIFAVGALDGNNINWPIASFSSRGPSNCDIVNTVGIKPEVSAPGVNVRSASGTNEYRVLSGTSMSGPHVSGAVLLLREAFPNITSLALKNALYQTAIDLGDPGEDNVYGRGMIDVYAAYQYLSQTYTPTPPITNQYDISIDSIIGNLRVSCEQTNPYEIIIKNSGLNTLSNFIFRLVLNEDTIIENPINISLQAGETYTIPVIIDLTDATNSVTVEIEKNGINEFNIYNNYRTFSISRLFPNTIPYYEDFENLNMDLSASNYYLENPDFQNTWHLDSTEGIVDSYKSLNLHFLYYYPREGQLDYLQTGSFNIPITGNTYLFFKHSYTQKYSTKRDSLYIVISNSCDMSAVDTIYKEGGAGLKTRPDNYAGDYTPSDSAEWADNELNLTSYAGQTIFIQFITKNDGNQNLYIDEFKVENGLDLEVNSLTNSVFSIRPNPAKDKLQLSINNKSLDFQTIEIYDITGKIVKQLTTNHKQLMIDISVLEKGIYLVKLGMETEKLIIE